MLTIVNTFVSVFFISMFLIECLKADGGLVYSNNVLPVLLTAWLCLSSAALVSEVLAVWQ